jgi:hypothetical protein
MTEPDEFYYSPHYYGPWMKVANPPELKISAPLDEMFKIDTYTYEFVERVPYYPWESIEPMKDYRIRMYNQLDIKLLKVDPFYAGVVEDLIREGYSKWAMVTVRFAPAWKYRLSHKD